MKLFTKIFLQVICLVLLLSSGIFFLYNLQVEKSEHTEYQQL